MSGPSAIFRLSGGQGRWLTVSLGLPTDSSPAADIVFRYLQRLSLALAERLDWLRTDAAENAVESGSNELREHDRPIRSPGRRPMLRVSGPGWPRTCSVPTEAIWLQPSPT